MSPKIITVLINKNSHTLPVASSLADAIAQTGIQQPFAAAVNMQFVPRSQYDRHVLADNDRIDLIAPVTGG
jgi:sulfur carrier protein